MTEIHVSRIAKTALRVASDRFSRLNDDAPAAVREVLARGDDDLVRWALNAAPAADLRERWGRELVQVAAAAVAPIWAEYHHQQWRQAIDSGASLMAAHQNDGPPWPALIAGFTAGHDEREARFAQYKPRFTDWTDVDEWEWAIYTNNDDNGLHWAVSTVLSYAEPGHAEPILSPDTRRAVEQRVADDIAARPGGRLVDLVARLSAPWEWLGGWNDKPTPDDGPVPDGFEVVGRFTDQGGSWRILRPAGPPRYLMTFARDLWLGRWHAEAVEARRGLRYPPALILPAHRDLGQAMEFRRVEVNPAQMTLPGLVPVMTVGAEAVRAALVAAEALSSTVAQRLVRWIVRVAAMASSAGRGAEVVLDERAVARQTAAGVEIEVGGGFDALRRLLGITKKGREIEIEAVVAVFAAHSIPWAVEHYNGGGPLLTFKNTRPRPGMAAHLVLSVSPLLCPGMASDKTLKASDRVLVPSLPPPPLPPGGRAHGGLLTLDWLALLRLAELRAELRAEGGVRLDWPRLAAAAGVSPEPLARALILWTNAETGRWVELPDGLWRLADRGDEGRAHELLIEGAAMSAAASEAGKRSASRRQAARNRYG